MSLLQKWATLIEQSAPAPKKNEREERGATKWDTGKSHVFYTEISNCQQDPYTASYHKTEFVGPEL